MGIAWLGLLVRMFGVNMKWFWIVMINNLNMLCIDALVYFECNFFLLICKADVAWGFGHDSRMVDIQVSWKFNKWKMQPSMAYLAMKVTSV